MLPCTLNSTDHYIKPMADCVRCSKKMLNYSINYANIEYRVSLCWRARCNGYFEIVPDIPTPITDAIARDPNIILDLLAQKALKPIL